MRTRLAVGFLATVALCAAGCRASGESVVKPGYDFGKVKRLAVLEVQGAGGDRAGREFVADLFGFELLSRGYDVLERTQIKSILAEQEFAASKLTTAAGAAEAGKLLNVDAAMIVNIPECGAKIALTSKLVDVESGMVVWSATGSGTTGGPLGAITGGVVGAGTGAALGGSRSGRIFGGAAGGALGAVAGTALTPAEDTQLRKVIKEMLKGFPSR